MSHKDFILAPSLLSSDFGRIYEELKALEEAGLSWIHWDVMDGNFVPNISLGPPVIAKCRPYSRLFFDVHLMIENPNRYIQQFADSGADLISIHAEATRHLESAVSYISSLGVRSAVALNPHTPLSQIEYLLPQLDMVLIMSVNPGFGGQKFIPFTLTKIYDLKKLIEKHQINTDIQVDGGVDLNNAGKIVQAGANILVSGSSFFHHPPYLDRYQDFQKVIDSYR